MYVNPWKFSVGDLVEYQLLPATLPLVVGETIRKSGSGVIVDRRRKEIYVEARPIRIAEVDEYCIVLDGSHYWAPEQALVLSQRQERED